MKETELSKTNLTPSELDYYHRQLILPGIGVQGQLKLKNSSVLIVGMGGLGNPLSMYLAAAGVGKLGLIDFDIILQSNLHRQIMFGAQSVGKSKVEIAKTHLSQLNPHIEILGFSEKLDHSNASKIIGQFDNVADGCDDFETRYLVNDVCHTMKKPLFSAAISQLEGQLSLYNIADGPCYRCLFPSVPSPEFLSTCAQNGVLGTLPGVLGTLQAAEVVKWILGIGTNLLGRLLLFNALDLKLTDLKIRKNPSCKLCGDHPEISDPKFTGSREMDPEIEVVELKRILLAEPADSFLIVDLREESQREKAKIETSVHFPFHWIYTKPEELNLYRGKKIIFYCEHGETSKMAVGILKNLGFQQVFSLKSGITGWLSEDLKNLPAPSVE